MDAWFGAYVAFWWVRIVRGKASGSGPPLLGAACVPSSLAARGLSTLRFCEALLASGAHVVTNLATAELIKHRANTFLGDEDFLHSNMIAGLVRLIAVPL